MNKLNNLTNHTQYEYIKLNKFDRIFKQMIRKKLQLINSVQFKKMDKSSLKIKSLIFLNINLLIS